MQDPKEMDVVVDLGSFCVVASRFHVSGFRGGWDA